MLFSRKEISRAGETMMTSNSNEDVNVALSKINKWRSHHLHPLRVMKNGLVRLCEKNRVSPILISQRLKRLTSIQYKLDLNVNMGLGGMQDIGGYRAVLRDVKDLKKLKLVIEDSKINHKLEKIRDYTEYPKISGYRSIHYIYKYNSSSEKYNDLRLELQIRTKLQHNWATAVETAGIITNTSLKSSMGPDKWLDFFKVISSLFALKEKLPVLKEHSDLTVEELMIECHKNCVELNVIEHLKALGVSTKHLEKQNFPGDYYLIHIDVEDRNVNLSVFDKNSLDEATSSYLEVEKQVENSQNAVVLVSANSLRLLKKAYPSYFLDTTEFLSALEKINDNCVKLGLVKT
jgi:putative GTP pyrophosphokinase